MNCRQIQKKLSAYQDGEVTESQKAHIERHLKVCNRCSAALQQLEQLWDLMSHVETIESAPYFWTKVSQRWRERTQPQPLWRPRFAPVQKLSFSLLVITLLVLGFAIGMFLGQNIYHSQLTSQSSAEQELERVFPMNSFDDFPEQSVVQVYVSMISENNH